jgi:pimeloyl-ACP methyl ester carboxylesterase
MPFYEKGDVRIRYEEVGSGFPLLLVPGGGLNSRMSNWPNAVFNSMAIFQDEFRCITMDQRNANGGESIGPIPTSDPWGAFADDQLGLMDHLGIKQFLFIGYCIGGCFAGKLMQRAPDRVVGAVFCQSVGHRPEDPTVMYRHSKENWVPDFLKRRPDVSTDAIEKYSTTFTRLSPISSTACRAILSGTAKPRCWCCRMTCHRIRCKRRSMSPPWHPMPRSRSSRGRSRKN